MTSRRKQRFLSLILGLPTLVAAQNVPDSVTVEARMWSRDKNREIQYSDWKPFRSTTVDRIPGFKPVKNPRFSQYGGDASRQWKASGFFRTERIDGRWWIIDPTGHPYVTAAVNSVRAGQSANNKQAFDKAFGSPGTWISKTQMVFEQGGFTGAGSWSEVDVIRQHNQTARKPIVYTTMLGFLTAFERDWKKNHTNVEIPAVPLLILEPTFAQFCRDHARQAETYRADANLLGHFSDNEIAFSAPLLEQALKSQSLPAYTLATDWLQKRKANTAALSAADKDEFLGYVAGVYYQAVATALKANDPNHLYLGTRLHANAKYNPAIFAAAEPYVDMISINFYGHWRPTASSFEKWATWSQKPFFITEFYTKAADTGMTNKSGAGWLVKTQQDRGIHYQNFCLALLQAKNCVGWHWFRYQDNDPADLTADPSNNDSNKGIVDTQYQPYDALLLPMKKLNENRFQLIKFLDQKTK